MRARITVEVSAADRARLEAVVAHRAMVKAVGISLSAMQGIWKAPGLVPHRMRTVKLSKDSEFITRLRDVVSLYMRPPAHAAVVLSVDEESQIQALGRTQPGPPGLVCPPNLLAWRT